MKNEKTNKIYLEQSMFLFVGSILLLIFNTLKISTLYTVVFIFLYHLIFVFIFFSDELFPKLLWTIIYSAYTMISDFLSAIIPIYVLNYASQDVLKTGGVIRIIFTLLYILILTLLILLTLSLDKKTFQLSKAERLIFSIISILCIVIEQLVLISVIYTYQNSADKNLYIQICVFILVFFLFFSLIFYVYKLGIEKDKNEALLEENLLTKINEARFEQVTTSIGELRVLKHDINNHLTTLSLLIRDNELAEASKYINTIVDNLDQNHKLISSGNLAIDCIVSNKLFVAQNNKIPVDYVIHLPSKIPLSNVDICSLLGNLLDNAIESCMKLPLSRDKFIRLYIKPFNNMLSIKIQNSSDGNYIFTKTGNFVSTKIKFQSMEKHGIGIKHVRNITEQYNGIVRFTPENDMFTVEMLFPLNNPEEKEEI
ncbi:MAG: sensor histidine kinase [Wujia sp.]